MLSASYHGGGCCGISNISNFGDRYYKDVERELRKLTKRNCYEDKGITGRTSKLVEVVLNEKQTDAWHNALMRIGYKLVTTFRNSNSKNKVYVYHFYIPVEED